MNDNQLFDGYVVFCAVVETGGFTAAARKLGHTASHVSKEIGRLEARLNCRLLNRTTRSVSLTEAGSRFYENIRVLIDDAQDAQQAVLDTADRPSGLLKISSPVSISLSCLNRWLPEFLGMYPDIRLEFEASDRMADVVGEGFDIVVRAGHLKDSELIAHPLGKSRLLTVASPSYLEKAGVPGSPDDLGSHVLIDFAGRELARAWDFAGTGQRKINVAINPRVICNSAESELALALAGVGITRLPSFACKAELDAGRLVPILEEFEKPPIGIFAIYPSRANLPKKSRVFVDFLAGKFRREAVGLISGVKAT